MSTWARDTAVLLLVLMVFVVGLIVTARLVPPAKSGPAQTCGAAGIYKVIPRTSWNELTVVCQNGRTYYP